MSLEKFLEKVKDSEKVIALDFDGVIHNDNKGFHDGTIYGSPIKGTKRALNLLSKKYKLVIYSCKSNPQRPLIGGKNGIELIWGWLLKWDLKQYISYVASNKPNALMYIDDKGLKFNNWTQTLNIINKLK